MTRTTAFGLGLMTFALFAYGVLGREPERLDPRSVEYKNLRNRVFGAAHVMPWQQCHEHQPSSSCKILDHIVPICLHALPEPNTVDNLQVQQCDQWDGYRCKAGESYEKDIDEIAACKDVEAGRTTRDAAVKQFKRSSP